MENKYFIEDGGLIVIEPEDFKDLTIKFPEEDNGEIKHYLGLEHGLDLLEYLTVFKVITLEDITDYVIDNKMIQHIQQKNETINYVNESGKGDGTDASN